MRGLAKAALCVGLFVGNIGVDFGVQKLHEYNKKREKVRIENQHKLEKKQAKQHLTAEYETNPLRAEAIFILPETGKDDGDSKKTAYQILDAFHANGVAAYMVGDTSGKATFKSIGRTIQDIQDKHHYQAVTVLSLTHGALYDLKTLWAINDTTKVKARDAWTTYYDRTGHMTKMDDTYSSPSTQELMQMMVDAAKVKKMDWVTFECYGGAQRQSEINTLPKGSMFVAMAGPGQVNYNDADDNILRALNHQTMQFDEGIDAPDFLVEALQENWRHYNADIIVGVSGGNDMAVIPSDNKYNSMDVRGATTGNHQQFERAKRLHLRHTPH